MQTERRLAEALDSGVVWQEAAQAKGGDLQMQREQGAVRVQASVTLAGRRAEQLALDVAALQAAALLQEVEGQVVGRELATLDGQVGFLRTQLLLERDALAVSREAEAGLLASLRHA